MKKDVAFSLPQGYTLRMTNTTTTATMFRATKNFTVAYWHSKHTTKITKGETIMPNENFRILNGFFFWVERVSNEQTTQMTKPLPIELIEKI